jgi:hypothetical protein
MEWINLHAMFLGVLGGDTLSGSPTGVFNTVKLLEPFLAGAGAGGPHADLAFLVIAPAMPVAGLEKWRAVQQSRAITGILGTDVHRNVSVDPVCAGSWLVVCQALAALFPNTLTLLISGGTIVLRDGDRVDSYARMMRWVENRLLVEDLTIDSLADALRGGRGYGLFGAYGDPGGFVFEGAQGADYVPIGGNVEGPVALLLRAPRPAVLAGAPFGAADAATAMVRTVLKRIDPMGEESTIMELVEQEETWEGVASAPGAYYVEVWVRPFHLATALGTLSELASREYLWLITNPIRVR